MNWQKNKPRFMILISLMIVFVIACIGRLVDLQIVKGNDYREQSERRLIRALPIKAPRGEILDRYGRPLVTNRMGFFIQIQKIDITRDELHDIINNLIKIMESENEMYIDTFPVTVPPFRYDFKTDDEELEIQKLDKWKKDREFDKSKTADDIIDYYKNKYKIADKYSQTELRNIIAVRYEMDERLFGLMSPHTFATDVGINVVQKIKEQSMDLQGVSVEIEPIREYVNGGLAAHILGRVGIIYSEEYYGELKDQNYGMNDIIGKDGMEKVLEKDLRGTNGVKSVEQTKAGSLSRILETKPAIPGHYAVLTLDAKLQEVAEKSLEKTTKMIRDKSRFEGGKGSDAFSGAAVAIDINSGEVLAMATCPTYDITRFNEDYQIISTDPLKPMLNRAINGVYEPGSTFKMATALSGLESNSINTKTLIHDTGTYMRFAPGYTPKCMGIHGSISIVHALSVSCNYFFYETGHLTTIEKMNEYSRKLGLGEPTGIELPESSGLLASPEVKSRIESRQEDKRWFPGDTIQAAIGQSYNMFTPAQLANYLATLVNGGKRYQLHLLKEIKDYETNDVVRRVAPTIVDEIKIKNENYKAIMEGMRRVTETGTASATFSNFPISVGGKTGTAQAIGTDNGIFVGFAPYDNPQIAIAVVVEHGVHGNSIAGVARDIIEAYFESGGSEDTISEPKNQLLR